MTILALPALKDNYIFVLDNGKSFAAIDPGAADPVLKYQNDTGRTLTHILCTHHHWDHVDGVPELVEKFKCEVWSSVYDAERIPNVTRPLKDGEQFDLLGASGLTISIPGHTLGHMAFYFAGLQSVFTGDTLFSAGCGRLFEGTYEQMFETLGKLRGLPLDTKIYFAHEYTVNNLEFVRSRWPQPQPAELEDYYQSALRRKQQGLPTAPTSLGQEMSINPFLRAKTLADFRDWREARNHWRPQGI